MITMDAQSLVGSSMANSHVFLEEKGIPPNHTSKMKYIPLSASPPDVEPCVWTTSSHSTLAFPSSSFDITVARLC